MALALAIPSGLALTLGAAEPDRIPNSMFTLADPKVVSAFNDTHIAQMLGCLNITGPEVALLLKFEEAALTFRRVLRGNNEKGLTTNDAYNTYGRNLTQ